MARINHGNLLQHAIECFAADRLAGDDGDLRLVATHAMAPFEPPRDAASGEPEASAYARVLRDLLGQVECMPPEGAAASPYPVVRAYAATGARVDRYPNTAELLAALLGRGRVHGTLCEVEPACVEALRAAWAGSDVHVEPRSWRDALEVLFPPEPLEQPWLFTMDPYTFRHAGERKREDLGGDLDPKDVERLRPCLAAHVKGAQPGAFTAFVYGVDRSHAKGFRAAMLALADRLGTARAIVGVDAPEGTRHVGAILASEPDLPAEAAESWETMKASLGLR